MTRERETEVVHSPGNVQWQENGDRKDMMGGLGGKDQAGFDFSVHWSRWAKSPSQIERTGI